MKARELGEIAQRVGGELRDVSPKTAIRGASMDSRTLATGDLFFALAGRRTHGVEFAPAALSRGAAAAVLPRDRAGEVEGPAWIVADPAQTLRDTAGEVRRADHRRLPVCAVTGSVGKTTVCGYLAQLVAGSGRVHRPPGSFNNHLGVPLTVLNAPESCEFLVCEIGTNAPGEVISLARLVRPRIAIVTAVAPVHVLGFGDLDGIAREKLSLLEALPPDGIAWVPHAFRSLFAKLLGRSVVPVRTFAAAPESVGADLELVRLGVGEFALRLRDPATEIPFRWVAPFPHSVHNLAAAFAGALSWGVAADDLVRRLHRLSLPPLRGEIERHSGVDFVLDCYNSNPIALASALEKLEGEPARGRRVAVIGTMEELGREEERWHRKLGVRLASPAIDGVFVMGRGLQWLRAGLLEAGRDGEPLENDDRSAEHLASRLRAGDRVLFKASRGDRLETFAQRVARFLDRNAEPS